VIFGALLILTLRFARNGLIAPLIQRLLGTAPKAELREQAPHTTKEEGKSDAT
jgi:hypothetical protein